MLAACKKQGVCCFVVPSIGPANWDRVTQLGQNFPEVYAALGIHPCFLSQVNRLDLEKLSQLTENHRSDIVAIGEIGLDCMASISLGWQKEVFEFQLKLAKRLDFPVIIHSRKMNDEVYALLKKHDIRRGVIHGFSGSIQQAQRFSQLGFCLGVGGVITYERANKTRNAIASVPLSALLLETDSPDMPIYGRQGKRNSPEYLSEILEVLAKIRSESKEEVSSKLYQNTLQLFGLCRASFTSH